MPPLQSKAAFRIAAKAGPWVAQALDGPSDTLVIAFASIGHDPTRAPSPEFVATATAGGRRPALFISDESRSWGHAPGLPAVLDSALADMAARGTITRIAAIGQSMGGSLALQSAALIPVDTVLALGPQSHLGDSRWQRWTATLPPLPPPPLTTPSRITLLHGMADDLDQAMGFPPTPGVDHILFPGISHSSLAPHLKAQGVLAGLLDAALAADRRRLLRICAGAGGRLRARLQLPR